MTPVSWEYGKACPPWQYFKSPRHPRSNSRSGREWDLLKPLALRNGRAHQQAQSLLFKLPPEVRIMIYHEVLKPYHTYQKHRDYSEYNLVRRMPQYILPTTQEIFDCQHPTHYAFEKYRTIVDWALLQSCQRIYHETWWIPLATATLRVNCEFASPAEYKLREILNILHRRHCFPHAGHRLEIEYVRIFHPYKLRGIPAVATLPHFYPQCIVLTVRSCDWFLLPGSEALGLRIRPYQWLLVRKNWLPSSVRELQFELEAREDQYIELTLIADLMRATWAFDRQDGGRLLAKPDERLTLYRWTTHPGRPVQQSRNRDIARFVGLTVAFFPVATNDPRTALPLDLPMLFGRGTPLAYLEGCTIAREQCPWEGTFVGRDMAIEYALALAKHPFVSRSWIPPPLPSLLDQPLVTGNAESDS